MQKYKRVAFVLLSGVFLISLSLSYPVFAAESDHITETIFFGNVKDDGSACGIFTVLNLVVDIFSIGVGILGLIGITIVGIKYLTAGGNEEQTRKAKHRMFQIVIGLVCYAALYAGAQFLLPGGKLDFTQRCGTISDEELAKIKAEEKAAEEATISPGSKPSSSSSSNSSSNNNTNSSLAEKIASTAEDLSWPKGTSPIYYNKIKYPNTAKPYGDQRKLKKKYGIKSALYNCNVFVRVVNSEVHGKKVNDLLRAALKSYSNFKSVANKLNFTAFKIKNDKNFKSSLKRGDIVAYKNKGSGQHIYIYLGNSLIAQANHRPNKKKLFSHIEAADGRYITTSGKKYVYVARPK